MPQDAQVLVAAGAWTPRIMALMDLYAPVYPLKGYAMSVSADEVLKSKVLKPKDLPTRIVSDKYMYTSRLGDEIRITSIGEFSSWSTQPTPDGKRMVMLVWIDICFLCDLCIYSQLPIYLFQM